MSARRVAAALLATALAAALLGCGGAEKMTKVPVRPTTRPSAATTSSTSSTTAPKPPGKTQHGVASFRVPGGDNSIPEYGSEAGSSTRGAATASLRTYLEATRRENWAGACLLMAQQVRKQLAILTGGEGETPGCAAAFGKLLRKGSASKRSKLLSHGLASLRVEGDKAFALFYGSNDQQYMMPMVNEGGMWKVNQIAPIPYPPGVSQKEG